MLALAATVFVLLPATTPAFAGPWSTAGPEYGSGILARAALQGGGERLFSGTLGGRVYVSDNSGASWSLYSRIPGAAVIYGIEPSPNFASDGLVWAAGPSGKVYKSTDSGVTWSTRTLPTSSAARCFAIDPTNSQKVFVGTSDGLFLSTTGGSSWTRLSAVVSGNTVYDVAIQPGNPNRVIVGCYDLLVSSDGGSSFSVANTNAADCIEFSSSNPNVVLAGIGSSGDVAGLYRSTDGGLTWSGPTTGSATASPNDISFVPGSSSVAYAACGAWNPGIFKTTNGGVSWSKLTWSNVGGVDGLYAGSIRATSSGVVAETIHGSNWSGSPAYLGEGMIRSIDSGITWVSARTGFAPASLGSVDACYASASTLYATSSLGAFVSTDAGASWNLRSSGLGRSPDIVAVHPTNPAVALVGGTGLYRTSNAGSSWAQVSGIDTAAWILAAQYAPSNPNRAYVGTYVGDGGFFRTDNGGISWTNLGASRSVRSIAVNPANHTELLALFDDSLNPPIRKSIDGGTTWTNSSTGLIYSSYTGPWTLEWDSVTGSVYAGYNQGSIYESRDGGSTWRYMGRAGTGIVSGIACNGTDLLALNLDGSVYRYGSDGVWRVLEEDGWPTELTSGQLVSGDPNLALAGPRLHAATYLGEYTAELDTLPPVTQSTVSPPTPDGRHGWYLEAPTISLASESDAQTLFSWTGESPYSVYSEPLVAPAGAGQLHYYSVDSGGCVEGTKTLDVSVDIDPPTTVLAEVLGSTPPTVTLSWTESADSQSGVDYYEVLDAESRSQIATTAELGVAIDTLDLGELHTLVVRAVDDAGREGADSNTIMVDLAPPTTTLSAVPSSPDGTSGWYVTTPVVTLTRDDTGATFYQFDAQEPNQWTVYSAPSIMPEGVHRLYYFSTDSSNNTETIKSQEFLVDTLPPEPVGNPTATASGTSAIQLVWDAADDPDGSGLSHYTIYDSSDAIVDTSTTTSLTVTGLSADTAYTFYVTAVDVAGNESDASDAVSAKTDAPPDTIPPVSAADVSPATPDGANDWYVSSPSIALTSSELGSLNYQWDATSTAGWTVYSEPLAALEGEHTLYYFGFDLAGNREETRSLNVRVDQVAPVAVIPLEPANGAAVEQAPALRWQPSSDAHSGLLSYEVILDDSSLGCFPAYTYQYDTDVNWGALRLVNDDGLWRKYLVERPILGGYLDRQNPSLVVGGPDGYLWAQAGDPGIAVQNFGVYYEPITQSQYDDPSLIEREWDWGIYYVKGTRQVLAFGDSPKNIHSLSYCTGSASGDASSVPVDVDLTAGTHTWSVVTGDYAGNTSEMSASFTVIPPLDTTPPITTITRSPLLPDGTNDWYVTAPVVTLTRNEPGTTYYQLDSTSTAGWSVYSTPLTAPEGEHYLYYYSVDSAENTETVQRCPGAKVDLTDPSASVLSLDAYDATTADLSWTAATDTPSGVAGYRVYRQGISSPLASPVGTSTTLTGLSPATAYTLLVRTIDQAGRLSASSNTVSFTTGAAQSGTAEVGHNVPVTTPSGVTVTFDEVTGAGELGVTPKTNTHPNPAGFRIVRGSYFDISFSGTFTGSFTVTLPYSESEISGSNEESLKLFHWKDNGWDDITVSVDTAANTITGRADSFSDFGTAYPSATSGLNTPASSTWSLLVLAVLAVGLGRRSALGGGE